MPGGRKAAPAAVRRLPWVVRSSRRTPRVSSNRWIRRLRERWATCSAAAARAKFRFTAARVKYRTSRRSRSGPRWGAVARGDSWGIAAAHPVIQFLHDGAQKGCWTPGSDGCCLDAVQPGLTGRTNSGSRSVVGVGSDTGKREGKHVAITGGSSGFGLATAQLPRGRRAGSGRLLSTAEGRCRQPLAGVHALAGNAGRDATAAYPSSQVVVVVALVGMEFAGAAPPSAATRAGRTSGTSGT